MQVPPPVLSISLLLLAASSAVAADTTCKMLADANLKVYGMPTHIYSTEEAAYTHGKVRTSERVYLNTFPSKTDSSHKIRC